MSTRPAGFKDVPRRVIRATRCGLQVTSAVRTGAMTDAGRIYFACIALMSATRPVAWQIRQVSLLARPVLRGA